MNTESWNEDLVSILTRRSTGYYVCYTNGINSFIGGVLWDIVAIGDKDFNNFSLFRLQNRLIDSKFWIPVENSRVRIDFRIIEAMKLGTEPAIFIEDKLTFTQLVELIENGDKLCREYCRKCKSLICKCSEFIPIFENYTTSSYYFREPMKQYKNTVDFDIDGFPYKR